VIFFGLEAGLLVVRQKLSKESVAGLGKTPQLYGEKKHPPTSTKQENML